MKLREIILTKEDCESILQDLDDQESLTFSMEQEDLIRRNPQSQSIQMFS